MIKNAILMMLTIIISGTITSTTPVKEEELAAATLSRTVEIPEIESNRDKLEKAYIAALEEQEAIARTEALRQEKLRQQKQAEIDYIVSENRRKENVSFNPYDLTVTSGVTGEELYNTLLAFSEGSLAEYAWTFADVEAVYGINAFFMIGIVAEESGWGKSDRAIYQNNLTGHAVYNSYAEGSYFNSPEESIYNTANLLLNEYLTPGGHSYYGQSIWNVNTDYCLTEDSSATDTNWAIKISSIANDLVHYYHNNVKQLEEVPVL